VSYHQEGDGGHVVMMMMVAIVMLIMIVATIERAIGAFIAVFLASGPCLDQ